MSHEIDLKTIIEKKDFQALRQALANDPSLANAGVALRAGDTRKAHPLHRICDAVFAKKITEEEAIEIAKIFLEFGADIDGDKAKADVETPIITAASLQADAVGIFYIENGANVCYTGNDGETALHWAAYCGRDKLTERLIKEKADINARDRAYHATPLEWAVHTLRENDESNIYHQVDCVKLLLKAGADTAAIDPDSIKYLKSLGSNDAELAAFFE